MSMRSFPSTRSVVRRLLCLLALVFAGAAPGLSLGGDRPFSIEDMLRVAMVEDVRLSADGARAAFTVTRAFLGDDGGEMRTRIHLADRAKGTSKPVTPEGENCEKPRFSPDGAHLACRADGDEVVDVAVLNLSTGQFKHVTHGRGEVADLEWSPDGKTLAVTMAVASKAKENRIEAAASDVEIMDQGGGAAGLFLLSLGASASPKPLVTDREVGDFSWSPDGTRIAFETTAPDTPSRGRRRQTTAGESRPEDAAHTDIAVVDVRTKAVRLVASTPDAETTPRFSPDGRWLAYVATEAPGFYFNTARIMVVPTQGGQARALAATPDARPELLGWSAPGDAVYVREAKGTGAVILAVPLDGGPVREVSRTSHVVSHATLSPSRDAFGLVLEDCDLPAEAWVTPVDPFAPRQLSSVNREFLGFRLPKTEVVRWEAPDGASVEGLYTHPVNPTGSPPPLLVELHGGPALVADRQFLGALNYYPLAVFAERGYAIFRPNTRGSDGYGPDFRMANLKDWGGRDFADLQSGIDALAARSLADPKRLGVMGWRYGGYLAAWTIGHTDRFKAASVGAGITDLVSQAGSMDLPDFIPLYFGGEAYERFGLLFDHSPLKYAGSIKTPTLFQHGVEDERVPFTQSMELYTALTRLGVPTKLAAYPRSGHDVTEPLLIRDLMARNLDWFARYLPVDGSGG